jgi:hypothetical protein
MTTDTRTAGTPQAAAAGTEQIRAHRRSVRKLGRWTGSRRFDVRASGGSVVLDLILPAIEPGEIEIHLDIDRSMVKLLVPDGANVEDGDLRRVGRGRVKDWTGTGRPGGRTVRLVGEMRGSEVRVHRGGVAVLSLVGSRQSRRELLDAHREGRLEHLLDRRSVS